MKKENTEEQISFYKISDKSLAEFNEEISPEKFDRNKVEQFLKEKFSGTPKKELKQSLQDNLSEIIEELVGNKSRYVKEGVLSRICQKQTKFARKNLLDAGSTKKAADYVLMGREELAELEEMWSGSKEIPLEKKEPIQKGKSNKNSLENYSIGTPTITEIEIVKVDKDSFLEVGSYESAV